jgi:predicted RND superfamily exporter protein
MASLDAAKATFLSLFIPGMVALFSDGIGFFTLRVIKIPVIQELAIAASLGVAVLVMTHLVLLPLLMSYTGISKHCLKYLERKRSSNFTHWKLLSQFAAPPMAVVAIVVSILLLGLGLYTGKDQKIGDLDPGAPELRPDSRYNLDNKYLTDNFSTSTDVLVVMAETPSQACGNYETIAAIDYFQGYMQNVPGVQSVTSLVNVSKMVIWGMNEGDPRWFSTSRNQYILNNSLQRTPTSMINTDCSMALVLLFLDDHKADTLIRVTDAASAFAEEHNSEAVSFELAAGNSGVEAATNSVIAKAQYQMLAWVYGVVTVLCLLTFRSVKTVACIIIPLALTSVLGQGLMTSLGIGVKVATMPVIALGVGIGVDYGIYIYSRLDQYLSEGRRLQDAYYETLRTTGTAVAFTGFTLAIGVGTWIYSPIKFQADMGIMLTFMFLWNMVGALTLLPALTWLLRGKSIEKNVAAVAAAKSAA